MLAKARARASAAAQEDAKRIEAAEKAAAAEEEAEEAEEAARERAEYEAARWGTRARVQTAASKAAAVAISEAKARFLADSVAGPPVGPPPPLGPLPVPVAVAPPPLPVPLPVPSPTLSPPFPACTTASLPSPPLPRMDPLSAARVAKALKNDALALKALLTCPIGLEVMRDPVVAADGHTYERCQIEAWIAKRQAAAGSSRDAGMTTSPLTNEELASHVLFPNVALRTYIQQRMQIKPI